MALKSPRTSLAKAITCKNTPLCWFAVAVFATCRVCATISSAVFWILREFRTASRPVRNTAPRRKVNNHHRSGTATEATMPTTVVTLELGFECANCEGPVAATLRCEGDLDQLTESPCVPLKCPHCGRTNDVTFDPSGEVVDVTAPQRQLGFQLIWN